MKKATLVALKKSIKKWEKVVDGSGEDDGSENCALCKRFDAETCVLYGEQCPIRKKTRRKGCAGTPFITWQNHQDYDHEESFPYAIQLGCKKCVVLAKKELNFLKSLLPFKRKRIEVRVFHQKEPFDLVIKFIGEDGK